jgi:hypothetical protein
VVDEGQVLHFLVPWAFVHEDAVLAGKAEPILRIGYGAPRVILIGTIGQTDGYDGDGASFQNRAIVRHLLFLRVILF